MKNKTKLPILRTENLVVKELPNEVLIYDLENNKAFCLNETARFIMDECDGTKSIDDALTSLNNRMTSKIDEDMVWMVIEQFKNSNFLEKNYEIPVATSRVTRRRILQSAAALGIALPIVTSLVAPIAAYAQSTCIGQGGPCVDQGDPNCCPNTECVFTEVPPTGLQCVGCIPLGQPCLPTNNVQCCGGAVCFPTEQGPTFFQCIPPLD